MKHSTGGTEFEADTVKKIHLHGIKEPTSVYLISLIEHKSQVDYNVTIQLLKYMIIGSRNLEPAD